MGHVWIPCKTTAVEILSARRANQLRVVLTGKYYSYYWFNKINFYISRLLIVFLYWSGPFALGTAFCSSGCYSTKTFMFDVEAVNVRNIACIYFSMPWFITTMLIKILTCQDVFISSISITLKSGTSDVSIYTASGGFSDQYQDEDSWTQIFSSSFTSPDSEFSHISESIDHWSSSFENISYIFISSVYYILAWVETTMHFNNVAVSSGSVQRWGSILVDHTDLSVSVHSDWMSFIVSTSTQQVCNLLCWVITCSIILFSYLSHVF